METDITPKMRITEKALFDIITHIGSRPPESGGALFSDENDIIQKFVYDRNAKVTGVTYNIDHHFLNSEMKRLRAEGLYISGICHSHPGNFSQLSAPDRQYFHELLTTKLKRETFFAPIVHSTVDSTFQIIPYILNSSGTEVTRGQLEICYDNTPIDNSSIETSVKIHPKQVLNEVLEILLFLLKIVAVLFAGWVILKLFIPLPQYIINILTHGTH